MMDPKQRRSLAWAMTKTLVLIDISIYVALACAVRYPAFIAFIAVLATLLVAVFVVFFAETVFDIFKPNHNSKGDGDDDDSDEVKPPLVISPKGELVGE